MPLTVVTAFAVPRDVTAHVISYDRLRPRELAGYTVPGQFRSSRINAIALARYQALTPELLALLMARLGRVALPDGSTHRPGPAQS